MPPSVEPSKPAPEGQMRRSADFVAVVVQPGDSLASLAALYLGDPGRGWEIADFNGVSDITPGQELAIPLKPLGRGGLSIDHYQTVPVLSYHRFAEKSTDKMTVSRESFDSQMGLLKARGYSVITLDQLFDFMEFKLPVPEKSVVITIDDGWQTVYDVAYPILRKYNFPATIFVYTELITGTAKTLSWEQLREMMAGGLDIQCHTVSHRNLAVQQAGESMDDYVSSVMRELVESSRVIERQLGKKPSYLAYPYGATNGLVITLLKKAGYRGAATVVRDENPFFLSNFRVNRSMIYGDFDLPRFEKNLVFSDRKALR